MIFYPVQLPSDLLRGFDCDLQQFYHEVLRKEIHFGKKPKSKTLKQALEEVKEAYHKDTLNDGASSIRFTQKNRCAYVFRNSVCFTNVVAHHLHQMLMVNPAILHRAILNCELSMCCLGGGPASDVVALSKIVHSVVNYFWIRNRRPVSMTITVVDLDGDWEATANNVLKTLEETPEFFDFETMGITFKFIQADLTQPMQDDVKWAVSQADIVTMVKFVSAVRGSQARDKCPQMIWDILREIKTGAILFFLDSGGGDCYSESGKIIEAHTGMKIIYGPNLNVLHTLSMDSIKMFLKLYPETFYQALCLPLCIISVTAWRKTEEFPEMFQNPPVIFTNNSRFSECKLGMKNGFNHKRKQKKYTSVKLERFREKLRRLVEEQFDFGFEFSFSIDDEIDGDYDVDFDFTAREWEILFPTKSKSRRIIVMYRE